MPTVSSNGIFPEALLLRKLENYIEKTWSQDKLDELCVRSNYATAYRYRRGDKYMPQAYGQLVYKQVEEALERLSFMDRGAVYIQLLSYLRDGMSNADIDMEMEEQGYRKTVIKVEKNGEWVEEIFYDK